MIQMKTRNRIKIAAGLLALAALVPLTSNAEAIMHGRISFDAGGALIKGLEESEWSSASVNTLVLESDTLWVDNGGTAEVEFSGGSFLRMADGSKAEMVSLPPNGAVRGWIGSFYIQRLNRSQGDFVFYTPAGAVEVDKDSMVRVDIVNEGVTTVSTRWGRATVRTDAGGNVMAYAGKRIYIETGLLPSEPTPYDRSAEDAFDRWNRERAEYLATGSTQAPVDISNDTLGVNDLDRYGEWVTIDSRPHWRPTVVVDYTPYRYGYWNSVNRVGNVWVGNYPFCYVTSHYGYWDYAPTYGWVWSYDRVWSPARCATVQYGDYFVWAPVNRYYRPVYPTTSAYFSIGGVSFGYFGTSCVRVSDLYLGPTYVNFANYSPFRQYYGRPNVTVNIWNINAGSRRPHIAVPFNNSVTTVRDYTPRRSIRGATSLYASNRSASERVQRLESTSGRNTFSRASRTGSEYVRTDSARIDRGSRTRNVQLTEGAPDYSRASRSNPITASSTRTRSEATVTSTRDRQSGTRNSAPTTRAAESTRSTAGERGTRTTSPAITPRDSSDRTTRTRTSTANRNSAPQRTDIDPGFDSDSVPMRTRTPTRTRAPQAAEVAPRATSTPDRTRAITTPDTGRNTTRSTASSSRTETRTTAPRVTTAPDRVTNSSSTRSQATTRPSTSTRYTAPSRPQTTAPSTRDRSRESTQPAVRQPTAPVSRPSVSAPSSNSSRSYTAPSRATSAPESRSRVSTPAPSTSRSYTAPSRQPSSSRSYTAPSSSSSRSYTAPSASSSRGSASASPSRSTGGRSVSSGRSTPTRGR